MIAANDSAPKDEVHSHGKYPYASADSIYVTLRRAIAEAGLHPYQQEISLEITKGKGDAEWIMARYAFALITDPGDPPDPETCEHVSAGCPLTGASSFAAIRTYAQKYWLRGKFLIATGDKAEDMIDAKQDGEKPPKVPEGASAGKTSTDKKKSKGEWKVKPSGEYYLTAVIEDVEEYQRTLMARCLKDFALREYTQAEKTKRVKLMRENADFLGEKLTQEGFKMLLDRWSKIGLTAEKEQPEPPAAEESSE